MFYGFWFLQLWLDLSSRRVTALIVLRFWMATEAPLLFVLQLGVALAISFV